MVVSHWSLVDQRPMTNDQRLTDEDQYGCTSDLEGLPENQPGEHPGQGVPGHRDERDDLVQPASRRMPDAHPAEEVVPALQPRSAELGDRQGLRVREGALRRLVRRGHREGPARVDPRDRSRAVRRRVVDRSDVRRPDLLSGAGRRRRLRRLRGHARRDEGEGGHRQAGAVRPRVPRRRASRTSAAS